MALNTYGNDPARPGRTGGGPDSAEDVAGASEQQRRSRLHASSALCLPPTGQAGEEVTRANDLHKVRRANGLHVPVNSFSHREPGVVCDPAHPLAAEVRRGEGAAHGHAKSQTGPLSAQRHGP